MDNRQAEELEVEPAGKLGAATTAKPKAKPAETFEEEDPTSKLTLRLEEPTAPDDVDQEELAGSIGMPGKRSPPPARLTLVGKVCLALSSPLPSCVSV